MQAEPALHLGRAALALTLPPCPHQLQTLVFEVLVPQLVQIPLQKLLKLELAKSHS